jgi:hypothetical protein
VTGGVFTEDFIQNWIEYKLDNEVNPMRLRPHPYELSPSTTTAKDIWYVQMNDRRYDNGQDNGEEKAKGN